MNRSVARGSDQGDAGAGYPWRMLLRARFILSVALVAPVAPLVAQGVGQTMVGPETPPPVVPDTVHPPLAVKPVPYLPGAVLPAARIIAFYGTPQSTRMGILGQIPPAEMMAKLEATAKQWARADTTRAVRPALHLIVTVAMDRPGPDGKYRNRHGDAVIGKVAAWAEAKGWLLFLDIQVGWSSVEAEIPRLIPWLRKPWVHLAIDPEFAMRPGHVPGKRVGTVDAADVNHAIDVLAGLVDEGKLPPKVLVVHRYTEAMLTGHDRIRTDPRVQVVIDADGFGVPSSKKAVYDLVVTRRPVQFSGFKLFYKNDRPMMTMAEVLALRPQPLYIQYQ